MFAAKYKGERVQRIYSESRNLLQASPCTRKSSPIMRVPFEDDAEIAASGPQTNQQESPLSFATTERNQNINVSLMFKTLFRPSTTRMHFRV